MATASGNMALNSMERAAAADGGELWRECASWLTRCDVLRTDHKANWPDSAVSDLAYTLRDGVLLCNLLNRLEPGCIDMKDVNQKPQMAQFLCLRNIKTFLQVCKDHFGIKESDLFEPSMLFDLSDFSRVLHTLSKLSNSMKIQSKSISGFSFHKPRTSSQEDIYKTLQTTEDEAAASCAEVAEYGSYYSHIQNEEVYQDLCSIHKQHAKTQIPPAISHTLEKRDYVINELVETEKNYVDVLTTLQCDFMRPLNNVLRKEDSKVIFAHIKELCEIHSGFHSQLRKTVAPHSSDRLSEVFLKWREKFLIYGDYCVNLSVAQAKIQEVCNNNESINQEVIKCQQNANDGKFKLRDILSVPMQRILKYHLLLEKLIKETQPSHPDYKGLERAKEAMVDVAQYINEVKRDSDTLQIMKDIQESICEWATTSAVDANLEKYGRLLKDGELRVKAHDDQKVKVRYIFIFDKVMLMCKAKGDQYCVKDSLPLEEYRLEEVAQRKNFQWFLAHKTGGAAFTIYARSEEMKRKWIKAIQDALDNIEPAVGRNSDHQFHLQTFTKPTVCNHCSKYLKGRIFQGYECGLCHIACHKACIPLTRWCGIKLPPDLPPRPLSHPLTTRTHSDPSTGTISRSFQSHPSTPMSPVSPHYNEDARPWNEHDVLKEYLWFVGEMGRDQATNLLEQQVDGTYLLRIRPQGPTHPNETVFALSMKTDDKVKHMKVYEREVDGVVHYYLSESRYFRSIVELISCYEHNSLEENFVGLDVTLEWPFRRIIAIAEHDFNPTEPNQLPLKRGCQVIVLSKEGDVKGWWKGKVHDRVGFFPKVYVREVPELDIH